MGPYRGLAPPRRPWCHPLVLQGPLLLATLTFFYSLLHPRHPSSCVLNPCAVPGTALIRISYPPPSESLRLSPTDLALLISLPMTIRSPRVPPLSLPPGAQSPLRPLRDLGIMSPPSLIPPSILPATCTLRNTLNLNRLSRTTPSIHMACQFPHSFVQSKLSRAIPVPQARS